VVPASPPKQRAAALSIASNTTLIVLKVVAGVVTGSVGILSDAVHSVMDLAASVIALLSVRKADEPADARHRYGHEKLEDLAASGQAVLLLGGAAFVAFEAIHRLIHGSHIDSIGVGIVVVAVAAGVNLIVSAFLLRTGRRTESAALRANAADLRTDAVVSLGVLTALVLIKLTGAHWIDPVVGLLVAVAISSTGVRVLVGASRRLVDETLPAEELDDIERVVYSFMNEAGPMVGFHDLRARHSGSRHEVDLHVQFAAGTTLEQAHLLAHRLQDEIQAQLSNTTVLVHLEPEHRVRADRFA
jgi:cation diffusion facilitator family transporter